jgi:hypothetical protein
LIGAKRARLAQQLIDQGRLAMIDVRNDGDITNFIHWGKSLPRERAANFTRECGRVKLGRQSDTQVFPSNHGLCDCGIKAADLGFRRSTKKERAFFVVTSVYSIF